MIGNINGAGAILRDSSGAMLWAALGPLHDMDDMQVIMWATQAGIIEAWKKGFHAIHVETSNKEVYNAIRLQDVAFPPPNLEEPIRHFNTMFSNNFIEDITARRVSIIPLSMNATAEYMATYGLNNLTQFVEAPVMFDNLQYYLDRDMGLTIPMEIIPNFGIGEVVDEFTPQSPTDVVDLGQAMPTGDISGPMGVQLDLEEEIPESMEDKARRLLKGKSKVHSHSSTSHGEMLYDANPPEDDCIVAFSKKFGTIILDVNQEIFPGIYTPKILENLVQGKLATHLQSSSSGPHLQNPVLPLYNKAEVIENAGMNTPVGSDLLSV